jgi:hypothetical protein
MKANRFNIWLDDKLIQKDICFECSANENIIFHHIIPYSKGGRNTIPLCQKCHGLVHGKDFLKLDKLRRDAYFKRRKENPWKSGRKEGIVESIETFMAKERSQKIKYLLEAGYSYRKISDMVNCSTSLVVKVSKIRKQQKTKSDNSNT